MIRLKDGRIVYPSTGIGRGDCWIAAFRKPNGSEARFKPIATTTAKAEMTRSLYQYAYDHCKAGVRVIELIDWRS